MQLCVGWTHQAVRYEPTGPSRGCVCVGGFTPDGRTVVTAGGETDGSIRVWDPKSGDCTATVLAGHNGHSETGITCLAFGADSSIVATGGVAGEIVISNIANGKPVARFAEHTDSVEGIAFANGLQLLVSVSMDGTAVVWDTAARVRRGTRKHPAGVVAVAMQHKGPLFATACLDGAVRVLDVRDAQEIHVFGGHQAAVQAVDWAPDDVRILAGGDDCTARIFKCS